MRTLILVVIGLISAQYLSSQNIVSVSDNFPKSVEKGKTYTVNVQIHKDGLLTYAQFSQKFPEKTSVKNKQNAEADFVYKNNELVYTWLRTPSESVIEIEYEFTISEKCAKKTFESKEIFSYIYQNRHGWVTQNLHADIKLADKQISSEKPEVKDNTTAGSSTNTNPTTETVTTTSTDAATSARPCVRTISDKQSDGTFDVTLNFTTAEIISAKLIERIPAGFEFIETDMQGAVVKSEAGTISLFWQNTPAKTFTVKYKLKNQSANTRPQYIGQLLTVQNGTIRKYDIK